MKKGIFLLIFMIVPYFAFASAKLMPIKFRQYGEISYLDFEFDIGSVNATKYHVKENKQVIIDFNDVDPETEAVLRGFDTSEFNGAVTYVKAYKRAQSPKDLRILVQLRDNVRSALERKGNKIILGVENRFGVFSNQKVDSIIKQEKAINLEGSGKYHIPKSLAIEDILENITLSGRKKYVGKKISLNVKELAVEEILKMIADASGFNIIITDEVKGLKPLTLTLTNVPWDQALDTILGLNKLVAQKNGIILMITTLAKATEEKRIENEAKKVTQTQEPLVTKIFAISYSTLADMETIVKEYITQGRGKITKDERTNSLIVKDTTSVIEKVNKIIEYLDTQTPQVLIESKIIEVVESYSKKIGLRNGVTFGYDPIGSMPSDRVSTGGTTDIGGGREYGPGMQFASATSEATSSIFSFGIGTFKRLFNFGFDLELLEAEKKLKVIATPKVVTQNKKQAIIESKDTTSYRIRQQDASGTDTFTFNSTDASVNLKVTPQVTNEGSIVLDVEVKKEEFGDSKIGEDAPPDRTSKNIKTNVLVENGATVVIGGLYKFKKTQSHSGIPFIKDIPLIGWLFRTSYNPSTDKSELIIFLTPRIINQEEAGLANKL